MFGLGKTFMEVALLNRQFFAGRCNAKRDDDGTV
jgi:hypothetical protein